MKRILVIDDDAELLKVVTTMLERAGYWVTTAGDGVEGLQSMRAEPADLVVTDIVMPDQEGLETITKLRAEFPHAPIIAMSGGGWMPGKDYLEIASSMGAKRTLEKPFSRDQLIAAVKDLIGE